MENLQVMTVESRLHYDETALEERLLVSAMTDTTLHMKRAVHLFGVPADRITPRQLEMAKFLNLNDIYAGWRMI